MKCFTCGNGSDDKYTNEPCPECGEYYKKKSTVEIRKTPEFITKSKSINIPDEYINNMWNSTILLTEKVDDKGKPNFKKFVEQLEKVYNIFSNGGVPNRSALIIAPPRYSKITWAYSCMQQALAHNLTVAPILDTIELKRLMILASENPKYKLYNSVEYDKYITANVCFVTITKTEYSSSSWSIILELLDRRSRLGLPTFFISRYGLPAITKTDYDRQFRGIMDFSKLDNDLKYPSIISYKNEF